MFSRSRIFTILVMCVSICLGSSLMAHETLKKAKAVSEEITSADAKSVCDSVLKASENLKKAEVLCRQTKPEKDRIHAHCHLPSPANQSWDEYDGSCCHCKTTDLETGRPTTYGSQCGELGGTCEDRY